MWSGIRPTLPVARNSAFLFGEQKASGLNLPVSTVRRGAHGELHMERYRPIWSQLTLILGQIDQAPDSGIDWAVRRAKIPLQSPWGGARYPRSGTRHAS